MIQILEEMHTKILLLSFLILLITPTSPNDFQAT